MFGYRLIRESDYDRLRAEIDVVRAKAEADLIGLRAIADHCRTNAELTLLARHDEVLALHERITKLAEQASARASLVDVLTMRNNVLEQEVALLRNKVTGLPQISAQIAKGSPLMSENLGAGVDLFEDVGDTEARHLRERGLLHDSGDIPEFPSAAELSDTDRPVVDSNATS